MRPFVPSTRLLVLGAILLAATLAAWGTSSVQHFAFGFDAPKWSAWVQGVDGELSFFWRRCTLPRGARVGWLTNADLFSVEKLATFVQRASLYKPNALGGLGFGYVHTSYDALPGGDTIDRAVWFPLWLLCVVVTIPVAEMYRRWNRARRRRAGGLCLTCGYDLRGSTSRCPECGEAVNEPAAEPAVP